MIKFNSVDYTELFATSIRALFPHARAFCHQKDEILPFDTNQYLAPLSLVLSPLPAQGGNIAKKRDFTVMTF
ncbi:hypothetical protein ACFXUV_001321 [Salmonella enterica]|nr:hypothetical protein [Salmonella enterica]EKR1705897.1 hypothetical protein [Salmonella enterica subsp. enterica serovar Carrau]EBA1296114.1 hypothetical protein [Salmonella enterica]EBI9417394.1 hypothetical protein [Salmonella enterica]EBK9967673.1 hypothetical protein [Salmonella enterica]